jgi:predicted acyltransferase (DUF342 family)
MSTNDDIVVQPVWHTELKQKNKFKSHVVINNSVEEQDENGEPLGTRSALYVVATSEETNDGLMINAYNFKGEQTNVMLGTKNAPNAIEISEAAENGAVIINTDEKIEGGLIVNDNSVLNKSLTVNGAVMLNNIVNVEGDIILNSNAKANKNVEIDGTLGVMGEVDMCDVNTSGSVTMSGTLEVQGPTTLSDILTVDGESTFNQPIIATSDLAVNGSLNANTITASGASSFNNNVSITEAATVGKNLTVNGSTSLNNGATIDGAVSIKNCPELHLHNATGSQTAMYIHGINDTDSFRIHINNTASDTDTNEAEIATADNGIEEICVRQYTHDGSGNR